MMSYIRKHWRGEFSLPLSYWVNLVLFSLPVTLYFTFVSFWLRLRPPDSVSALIYILILPYSAHMVLVVWQVVGVWRSAGHRIADGKPFWAYVARIVVVLDVALVIYNFFVYFVMTVDVTRQLWTGEASRYSLHTQNDVAFFKGEITFASSAALDSAIKANGIERLEITSQGGMVWPTLRVAETVHTHKVTVVVRSMCDSACAIILAAGTQRVVSPQADVAFHQPTFLGTGMQVAPTSSGELENEEIYYVADGVSDDFLTKIRGHAGPTDFYRPAIRELIQQGLVTNIYDASTNTEPAALDWCNAHQLNCDRTGAQNAGIARMLQ